MVNLPRLTVRTKRVRRHWAQKHINGPQGQWQHVIFCDESPFMLFRIDNRIRVRRLVGEAMNKDCTHGNVAHGGGFCTCMWWCLSYGKNLLVRSRSDVTGAVYRRVLEDFLILLNVYDNFSARSLLAKLGRPSSGGTLGFTGHGVATIGYWLMIMPDPIGLV